MTPGNRSFVFVVGTENDARNKSTKNHLSVINKHIALHQHEQRRKRQRQKEVVVTPDRVVSGSSATTLPSKTAPDSSKVSPEKQHHPHQPRTLANFPAPDHLVDEDNSSPDGYFDNRIRTAGAFAQAGRWETSKPEEQEDHLASKWTPAITSRALRRTNGTSSHWSPSPMIGIKSFLDPFFRLPFQLSEYERSLVHFYFTYVPLTSLGLKADGRFCPLRRWYSSLAQEYPSVIQWILTSSEDYISSIGGKPDQESLMVKRKADAYRLLRQAISNSDSDPDHALAGMLIAATSDEKNSRVHLRGLEQLVQSYGGNKAFGNVFKLMHPDFFILTDTFAPCIIPYLRELETSKLSFIRNLIAMNSRSRWLEAERLQGGVIGNEDHEVEEYFDALDEVLQCECLGPLLRTEYDRTLPYIRRARHFTMLFNLHKALLCFEEDDFSQQILFLRKLKHFCRESSARDTRTGQWLLRPGAVVSVIGHTRKYVLEHFLGEKEAYVTSVATSRATIDALQVFGYLSQESQENVVTMLRAWSLQILTSTEEWTARTAQIDELSTEITECWLNHQISAKVEELALCR